VEVYAIKACAVENIDRDYKNRKIYILSDSQAAIKTLVKYKITSNLVWDCHQSLLQVARHKRVQLIWVPGHEVIAGKETADLLARIGSEHPVTGPGPAFGISIGVGKRAVRDWMKRNHIKQWESTTGFINQAKGVRVIQQVKKKLSLYRPWRPSGLREFEVPTFSDIRLTDGFKVVSPMRRPLFTPRKIPGTHFC
jgi:hypothetical protein